MNGKTNDRYESNPADGEARKKEFSAAVARLEKAVSETIGVATGQLSERAAALLDDTSSRLEAEIRLRRIAENDPEVVRRHDRDERRRRYRHRLVERAERINPKSGRLYRDVRRQKIGGVCAGLAGYLGLEIWTVRLIALTGLLFIPGLILPAYLIAYFVMDSPDKDSKRLFDRRVDGSRRPYSIQRARGTAKVGREPPQKYNPGRNLRYARADLTEAELRLRRLESFVTSDQYELQKALNRMEQEEVQ